MPAKAVEISVEFTKVAKDVKINEAPTTYDNVSGYVVLAFGALGTALVSKKVLNK